MLRIVSIPTLLIPVLLSSCAPHRDSSTLDKLETELAKKTEEISILRQELDTLHKEVASSTRALVSIQLEIANQAEKSGTLREALLATIETSKQSLSNQRTSTDERFRFLENRLESLVQKIDGPAAVDPTSRAFSVVRHKYGAFPVLVSSVTPYLDGQAVIFRIGNTTSAAIDDLEVFGAYGPREPEFKASDDDPDWLKKYEQHKTQMRQMAKSRSKFSHRVSQSLEPGTWTEFEVIFPNTKSADLGHIDVSIDASSVSLKRRK